MRLLFLAGAALRSSSNSARETDLMSFTCRPSGRSTPLAIQVFLSCLAPLKSTPMMGSVFMRSPVVPRHLVGVVAAQVCGVVVQPVGEVDAAGWRVAGVGDEQVGGEALYLVAAEDYVADYQALGCCRPA